MPPQHRQEYRLPRLTEDQRQAFRNGARYTLEANEAIHLMPASEMPALQLESPRQVRAFFLKQSVCGGGKKDKNSQPLSRLHLDVSLPFLSFCHGCLLTRAMS
jgi:hypothetical protein